MNYTEQSLKKYIEANFKIGKSTSGSLSITGEPYMTIGSQHPDEGMPSIPGTVDEGKRREYGFDEETAWYGAVSSFQSYAEGRGDNLYWRREPRLERQGNRCRFYMRLLVSDR